MKLLWKVLLGVLGVTLAGVGSYFISNLHAYELSVDPVYGEAVAACQEDDRECSFASLDSAKRYLGSPEHMASVKMRELKEEQNKAAAQNLQHGRKPQSKGQ